MTTELLNYATIAKLHGLIGMFIFASGILQFLLKKELYCIASLVTSI